VRALSSLIFAGFSASLVACQVVGAIEEKKIAEAPATEPTSAEETAEDVAPTEPSDPAKPIAKQSCAAKKPGAGPSCGGVSGTTDCCDSPIVKGGKFNRNFDGNGRQVPTENGTLGERIITYDDPGYPARVSDFRLDAFEVTVGRFRAFVEANGGTQKNPPAKGAGAHPKNAKSGWDPEWDSRLLRDRTELEAALSCGKQVDDPITWTAKPGAFESHPMLCVAWYEAFAFCAWDGGRLPTDAELNYAASGGDEHRLYPWDGYVITKEHAVYGCYEQSCLPPVGSLPKGRGKWGHFDLLGSANEWVMDTYDLPQVPCTDCVQTQDWASRLTRGESYGGVPLLSLFSAYSNGKQATQRLGMGFRCARDM
jgi:formylglycine-generating enzyme